MKTKTKRRTYQTVNRKKQKAKWLIILFFTINALTAITLPYSLKVIEGEGGSNHFPQARVVKQEVKAEDHIVEADEMVVDNETVEQTIRRIAKEMDFKWTDYLVRLAYCESRLNPLAVNDRNNNPAHSKDRGLFQLNDYWHKNVPDSVAFDAEASTRWAIEKINNGGQGIWVCDRYVKANPSKYNPK